MPSFMEQYKKYTQPILTISISSIHGGNGPSICLYLLVNLLDFPFLITSSFVPYLFPMNPRETKNSYFVTQNRQRENRLEPVTNKSLFTFFVFEKYYI